MLYWHRCNTIYTIPPEDDIWRALIEADAEPLDAKMARLTATLKTQFAEGAWLEQAIAANLVRLGYEL